MKTPLFALRLLFDRVRSGGRALLQILALMLVWWCASWLVTRLSLPISAGVAGLLLVLLLLLSGVLKVDRIGHGARLLLGELVLFFIPCVVSVVQHGRLFRDHGVALVSAVVIGTLLVMVTTALTVHLACALEHRLARRARYRRWEGLRHHRAGEAS